MYKRVAGTLSADVPVTRRASPFIRTGANKNLIGVIAQGNTFAIYINRVLVITVTDDTFAKGYIGLTALTGPNNERASVAFTRVTILTPDKARAEWGSGVPSAAAQPVGTPATVAPPPPIVLPPCPSPLPAGMLYCEDFATKESQWCTIGTDFMDFAWSPYKYTITVKVKDEEWFCFRRGEYDNFAIEVEAQSLSAAGGAYGVSFRRSAEGHYYNVLIDSRQGQYVMNKVIAKTADAKWSPSPLIKPGLNKNLIGVIAQGNTFTIYINRVPVTTVTDSAFAKGLVGIGGRGDSTGNHASAAFTRVTILTPERAKTEWGSGKSP